MIIKDKYGKPRNTDKVYGIERQYTTSKGRVYWERYRRKYVTIQSVLNAIKDMRKAELWGSLYKFRIIHIYYDI